MKTRNADNPFVQSGSLSSFMRYQQIMNIY